MKRIKLNRDIASAPALGLGGAHPAIISVQRCLNRFGYLAGGNVTGVLDEITSSALTEYQRFSHLPQTGVLDPETRNLMTIPRCGLPDPIGATYFVIRCAWNRLDLTFAFDSGTDDLPGSEEHEMVRNAFRTWAATGYFRFREVVPIFNPHILIGWRPDIEFGAHILATAQFPPECSGVDPPLPLHFNDGLIWADHASPLWGVIDVETIALHEIGHCLGLDHSSVSGSVMQPGLSMYDPVRRSLNADDLAALVALYGSKDAEHLGLTKVVNEPHSFGDDDFLPGTFSGSSAHFPFHCPGIDVDGEAIFAFQARHVSHDQNIITINEHVIPGGIPVTGDGYAWAGQPIPAGVLKPTNNILRVESRSASGGTTSDLDDFAIRDVSVWYPVLERGVVVPLPTPFPVTPVP